MHEADVKSHDALCQVWTQLRWLVGNHDSLDKNTVTLENMETNTVLIQLATGYELEPLERRTWGYVLGLQKQTNKEKTNDFIKKISADEVTLLFPRLEVFH